jgi:hypothetical protein
VNKRHLTNRILGGLLLGCSCMKSLRRDYKSLLLLCFFFLSGCQTVSLPTTVNHDVSAEKSDVHVVPFHVVVVSVQGLYDLPIPLRPKAFGGVGEACPQLDKLFAGSLRINDLMPTPSSDDTTAWLHAASQGEQTCGLFGSAVDPGVVAGADWWVGQPHTLGGLPQRDNKALTGYSSHFPVRRLGMTTAVAQPMTRPWLLQIGNELNDFLIFQARAAAPFTAVVELSLSDIQLQTPDDITLRQYSANHNQADATTLARLDMANNVVSTIHAGLVWFHDDVRTLWILSVNDAPPGTSPSVFIYWPNKITAGVLSAPYMTLQTVQNVLGTLVTGKDLSVHDIPADLYQALHHAKIQSQREIQEQP